MLSVSGIKKDEGIKALNSTSRYLDDLLNIDNTYFHAQEIRETTFYLWKTTDWGFQKTRFCQELYRRQTRILVLYENWLPQGQCYICEDEDSFGWCNNFDS